jgi:hypothetical protein
VAFHSQTHVAISDLVMDPIARQRRPVELRVAKTWSWYTLKENGRIALESKPEA